MVRPFFAGLRRNHHPPTKQWSLYIALPFLSSNSAREARMPLLWRISVPSIASSVARQPGALKAFCNWLGMACTAARCAGLSKRAGSSSGSGDSYAWSAATQRAGCRTGFTHGVGMQAQSFLKPCTGIAFFWRSRAPLVCGSEDPRMSWDGSAFGAGEPSF